MKIFIPCLLALLLNSYLFASSDSVRFEDHFRDETMRVDFYQTGTKNRTIVSLDEIIREPGWAGSLTNLLDTTNFGEHRVVIRDAQTGRPIYSRGFSSIYNEWQTTDEAADGIYRTFHASVRFPFPKKPIVLILSSVNRKNENIEEFRRTIDPETALIRRFVPVKKFQPILYLKSGNPHQKVDLLILPEGYTKKEMRQFRRDVDRYMKVLFSFQPFSTMKDRFNMWYIEAPSEQSGIDNPALNCYVNTQFGLTYSTLNLDRYVFPIENKIIRDVAAHAPYDFICILFNSPKYGGGSIFNQFSASYSRIDSVGEAWWPDYVFIHEFGHLFGGLGDEYYSSVVSYNDFYPPDVEPWEPNLTTLINPEKLKWRDMVEPGTPLPTPWDKAGYDSLPRNSKDQTHLLRSQKYWGKIGCFEGAGYSSAGLYRPTLDCIMFSKSIDGFCPVCQNSILKIIRLYSE